MYQHLNWGGEERTGEWRIILTSVTDKKIQAIKALRAVSNLGLRESKEIVDGPYPKQMYHSASAAHVNNVFQMLVDESGSEHMEFHVVQPEWNDDRPDDPTIQLALFLARDIPIKPDEIRKIAEILNETPDPVTSLRQAAAMIETA